MSSASALRAMRAWVAMALLSPLAGCAGLLRTGCQPACHGQPCVHQADQAPAADPDPCCRCPRCRLAALAERSGQMRAALAAKCHEGTQVRATQDISRFHPVPTQPVFAPRGSVLPPMPTDANDAAPKAAHPPVKSSTTERTAPATDGAPSRRLEPPPPPAPMPGPIPLPMPEPPKSSPAAPPAADGAPQAFLLPSLAQPSHRSWVFRPAASDALPTSPPAAILEVERPRAAPIRVVR